MKIRKVIGWIAVVTVLGIGAVFFAFRDKGNEKLDVIAVNDIVQTLAKQWESVKVGKLPKFLYELDYVVLNLKNECIAKTKKELSHDLTVAIRNRDTTVDVIIDDKVLGKIIIWNKNEELWASFRNRLLFVSIIMIVSIGSICVLYALYLQHTIFQPFQKLKGFARHVAQGKLDLPLHMDKGNRFGAFSESFDLMREELHKARENERVANQSKKELVASLSHDIKTPVASIKAVSEVLCAKVVDDNVRKQLTIINSKADQINTLITNMFTATLEDLQELKVEVKELPSLILYELIESADYNHQVIISKKAECMIIADVLRLSQVIDNIISNSYKYAGTSIDVSFQVKGGFFEVTFRDYGLGVEKEEELFIFNKYFRAKNVGNKSGAGLGLYISKFLMEKMSGEIECENLKDGFAMRIKLKIA